MAVQGTYLTQPGHFSPAEIFCRKQAGFLVGMSCEFFMLLETKF